MKKLSFIFLISFLVLQLGCTPSVEHKQIKVSPDYVVAENLEEMVENSETIVIGTFQKYKHSYNAERDPKNEQQESKESYSETKVYAFTVEESLKGKTNESTIEVSIPYTRELTGLKDEQGKELRFKIPSIGHVQPKLGKKYVLFLMKNEKANTYHAPFTPYMIEIEKNNKVVLTKPQSHVETSFKTSEYNQYDISVEGIDIQNDQISGKNLSELKREMKNELNE